MKKKLIPFVLLVAVTTTACSADKENEVKPTKQKKVEQSQEEKQVQNNNEKTEDEGKEDVAPVEMIQKQLGSMKYEVPSTYTLLSEEGADSNVVTFTYSTQTVVGTTLSVYLYRSPDQEKLDEVQNPSEGSMEKIVSHKDVVINGKTWKETVIDRNGIILHTHSVVVNGELYQFVYMAMSDYDMYVGEYKNLMQHVKF